MAPDDHLSEVATDCPKLTVEHVVMVDGDEQTEPLETSAGGRMSLRPMMFTIVFSVMLRLCARENASCVDRDCCGEAS